MIDRTMFCKKCIAVVLTVVFTIISGVYGNINVIGMERIVLYNSFDYNWTSMVIGSSYNTSYIGDNYGKNNVSVGRTGGVGTQWCKDEDYNNNGGMSIMIGTQAQVGRIKFYNSIEAYRELLQEDLDRSFIVSFAAKRYIPGIETRISCKFFTVTGTSAIPGAPSATMELTDDWNIYTFEFSINQSMIDAGTCMFTIETVYPVCGIAVIDELKIVETTPDPVLELVDKISKADESELAVIFNETDTLHILGLDSLDLPVLSDMVGVYAYMVRKGGLDSADKIRDAYITGIILEFINQSSSGDGIAETVEQYADVLGFIGQNSYDVTYLGLSDTEKAQVWAEVISEAANLESEEELMYLLFKYSILTAFKAAEDNIAKFQVLLDNSQFLNLDFSRYFSLSSENRDKVAEEFVLYVDSVTDIFYMNDRLQSIIDKYAVLYYVKNITLNNSFNSSQEARKSIETLPYSSSAYFREGNTGGAAYSTDVDHTGNNGGALMIGNIAGAPGRAKFYNTVESMRLLTEHDVGRSFEVTFWAIAKKGTTPTMRYGLLSIESTSEPTGGIAVLSEEWQKFTYNFTITSNMIESRAYCFSVSGVNFYIDDLLIVETSPPERTIFVDVDSKGNIHILGMLKSGNLNTDVEVFLLDHDKTIADIKDPSSVLFHQTVKTDDLGRYSVKFNTLFTDRISSNLTFVISAVGYESKYIYASFRYELPTRLLELIEEISNADERELEFIFSDPEALDYLNLHSVDLPMPSDMTGVYSYMVKNCELDTLSKIHHAYMKGIIIELINESADGKGLDLIVEKYADLLGLSERKTYKNAYLKLSDTEKLQVWEAIAALPKAIENEAELMAYLFENTILTVLKSGVNYAARFQVFQDNADILNLDFSGYDSLSKTGQAGVAQEFVAYAVGIDDIFNMNGKLRELINKYASQKSPSNGGPVQKTGSKGKDSPIVVIPESSGKKEQGKNQADNQFSDLEGVEWAIESISHLARLGILAGEGNGIFNPNKLLTRDAFVKMLVIAFDLSSEQLECSFTDVRKEDWFYSYVAVAEAVGLANGKDNRTFGVGEPITRQDMAVMAFRALQISGITLPSEDSQAVFYDISEVSDYALEAVVAMKQNGIINGYDGYHFVPMGFATRAEAAKIVYGLLKFKK